VSDRRLREYTPLRPEKIILVVRLHMISDGVPPIILWFIDNSGTDRIQIDVITSLRPMSKKYPRNMVAADQLQASPDRYFAMSNRTLLTNVKKISLLPLILVLIKTIFSLK